jgi:hypothetical protein
MAQAGGSFRFTLQSALYDTLLERANFRRDGQW